MRTTIYRCFNEGKAVQRGQEILLGHGELTYERHADSVLFRCFDLRRHILTGVSLHSIDKQSFRIAGLERVDESSVPLPQVWIVRPVLQDA